MNSLQRIDEVSLRGARARILAEARANVANHVGRNERVAAALKTARDNIARLDRKRFPSMLAPVHAEQLHRQAAAARQRRVARVLGEARQTLARTAHLKARSLVPDEIVHRTKENARVVPAPSRQAEMPPRSGNEIDNLKYRFDVLREAVPEAMGNMIADLRVEWQRENDCLRRELDVTHRELDCLRRTIAGSCV